MQPHPRTSCVRSWPIVDFTVNLILFSLLFLQFLVCFPYMFKIPAVGERAAQALVQSLVLWVARVMLRALGKTNE